MVSMCAYFFSTHRQRTCDTTVARAFLRRHSHTITCCAARCLLSFKLHHTVSPLMPWSALSFRSFSSRSKTISPRSHQFGERLHCGRSRATSFFSNAIEFIAGSREYCEFFNCKNSLHTFGSFFSLSLRVNSTSPIQKPLLQTLALAPSLSDVPLEEVHKSCLSRDALRVFLD